MMDMTIGKRIAHLRKEKGLTQEELAQHMGISPQAVSKWENDQTCPDISALPKLARLFGVTVDELLEGKEALPAVRVLPPEQRKDIKDMILRVTVDSAQGDKIRVNLPMALMEIAMEIGMEMPQINGNEALKGIDMKKVLEMVRLGFVGNLVEVDSADGDKIRIFVE
ncbi:MAG: helix-turn-helix transcriptional regulator [Oscillospiraceae bacterium]|nr:helix-turn-helix transcriptional regulator [Oscillospiraceae bacterium]